MVSKWYFKIYFTYSVYLKKVLFSWNPKGSFQKIISECNWKIMQCYVFYYIYSLCGFREVSLTKSLWWRCRVLFNEFRLPSLVQLNDSVLKKIFLFLYSGSVHEAYLNAQCTFCRKLSVDEVLMKCLGSVSVRSIHFLRSLWTVWETLMKKNI